MKPTIEQLQERMKDRKDYEFALTHRIASIQLSLDATRGSIKLIQGQIDALKSV
jgi:hypothetical protein